MQVFKYLINALFRNAPIIFLSGNLGRGVDQGSRMLAPDREDDLTFVRPPAGRESCLDDTAVLALMDLLKLEAPLPFIAL